MNKLTFGLAAVALFGSATAYAGFKGNNGVYINTSARVAQGSMSDARADGSTTSRVEIYIQATSSYQQANIFFWDFFGNSAQCWTSSPQMVQAAEGANNDAFIYASWDANGQCTRLTISNDSAFSPKLP